MSKQLDHVINADPQEYYFEANLNQQIIDTLKETLAELRPFLVFAKTYGAPGAGEALARLDERLRSF